MGGGTKKMNSVRQRESTLSQLAKLINREFIGNDILINGLGLCNRKTQYESIVSYAVSKTLAEKALSNNAIKVLVLTRDLYEYLVQKEGNISYIIVENPEDEFYELHRRLYCETEFYEKLLFEPIIGDGCTIHPTAVIEHGVVIGNNVTIGPNSVINSRVNIGDNTHIGCCSIIGSEGFQILRTKQGIPYNVKHVGGTIVGRDVWIGDNVTVCNSIFEGAVEIGNNCQIDNHVQIAHNCILGQDNVLTAGVIMLGSSELRNNCWLAPGSLVMNKIVVENGGFVGANSMANVTVKEGETVIGTPAVSIDEFAKTQFQLKKIIKQNLK